MPKLGDQPQDRGLFETFLVSMFLEHEKALVELRLKIEGYMGIREIVCHETT